jgi:hypothetical protein
MVVVGSFHPTLGLSKSSAYVFRYDGTAWIGGAKIRSSDNAEGNYFGNSVGIHEGTVLIGAFGDDDMGANSGSAYIYRLEAATATGHCLIVIPVGDITGVALVVVTFENVVDAGTTTLGASTNGLPSPVAYQQVDPPVYFDVSTTAVASGSTTVSIDYTGISFENEAELRLFHEENSEWVDVTISQDLARNRLTGMVSQLSTFAIFERTFAPSDNIVIYGCDTGVPDQSYKEKPISEWIEECAESARNHGTFVSCVAKLTNNLKKAGLITGSEKGAIQSCAGQANIPK